MPELKFTAGLDASGVDAGEKKIKAAFAGIAKDANKMDAALKNAAGGFDEIAAGRTALDKIGKSIDQAAAKAVQAGSKFSKIGAGPYKIVGVIPVLNNVQKELAETAVSAVKLDSALAKGAAGSNTAAQSLQNLGRIAQDAPFGFIGIANNINPLLESFQRLRKESGSTGGALKSLAGSLAGGGGLGLAFSVITAAISFASIGLQAWKGHNTDAKKAVDENAKATEEYAKSLDRVRAEGAATGIQLQNYVNIAKDQSKSLSERNYALEQANKIFGEHGEKLTLVNVATAAVTAQIQKFTQATIQQALATKFADRAADLFINQKEAAKAYGVELEKLKVLQAKTQTFQNAQGVTVLTDAGKEVQKQLRVVGQLATAYKGVTSNIFNVVDELQKAQAAAANLFGQLNGNKLDPNGLIPKLEAQLEKLTAERKLQIDANEIFKFNVEIKKVQDELDRLLGKSKKPAVVKDIKTVNDVLEEMRKRIALLNKEEINFNTDNAEERYNTFINAIKTLNLKFGQSLDSDLLKGIFSEAKFAKAGFIVEKGFAKLGVAAQKAFQDSMKNIAPPEEVFEPVKITPSVDYTEAEKEAKVAYLKGKGVKKAFASGVESKVPVEMLNKAEVDQLVADTDAKIADFNNRVAGLINNQTLDSFKSFGGAIQAALSGASAGDVFGGFFKGILESLGNGIQKLGIEMLAANQAIKVAKALFGKAAGVGASVGLIALGGIIKALAAKIKVPAFAVGVRNFGGGTALVGERGPELVNLPRGSSVIPNAQTNSILGGQSVFIPDTVLRGQDIVISYKRASQSLNRTG